MCVQTNHNLILNTKSYINKHTHTRTHTHTHRIYIYIYIWFCGFLFAIEIL